MIISLHEDQCGQVRYGDALSEPFPIANGVKQGCVLTPALFTIFFSMMLQRAMADLDDENSVYIRYRTNGSLFNLRRLKAHTKTLNHLVRELLYADDAALVTHTEHEKNDYIPTAVFKVLESESGIGNELQFSDPLWPEQWELPYPSGLAPTPQHGNRKKEVKPSDAFYVWGITVKATFEHVNDNTFLTGLSKHLKEDWTTGQLCVYPAVCVQSDSKFINVKKKFPFILMVFDQAPERTITKEGRPGMEQIWAGEATTMSQINVIHSTIACEAIELSTKEVVMDHNGNFNAQQDPLLECGPVSDQTICKLFEIVYVPLHAGGRDIKEKSPMESSLSHLAPADCAHKFAYAMPVYGSLPKHGDGCIF
ncbi:hypothetical protein BTVI_46235 [Pitangus sulphuratus]|nr:hypothetical protein BTVI_46235 [Pitangus sulphuratus]